MLSTMTRKGECGACFFKQHKFYLGSAAGFSLAISLQRRLLSALTLFHAEMMCRCASAPALAPESVAAESQHDHGFEYNRDPSVASSSASLQHDVPKPKPKPKPKPTQATSYGHSSSAFDNGYSSYVPQGFYGSGYYGYNGSYGGYYPSQWQRALPRLPRRITHDMDRSHIVGLYNLGERRSFIALAVAL